MDSGTGTARSFSQVTIRNICWNFMGQIILALFAFFAMPYIVHKLGVDLYALYGLGSIVIGYVSFIQFGLGTASIKFIASHLAKREEEKVRTVFWTSLCAHTVLGFLGMAFVTALAPFLARKVLHIPVALQDTAIIVFYLVGVGFLVTLITVVMGALIQAAGRFDIFNKIMMVLGGLQISSAVLLLMMGYSLKAMLIASIIVQVAGICWYWRKIGKIFPYVRKPKIQLSVLLGLFAFGGFVTVSSIIGPLLMNVEKLFLSALVPISFLTYYLVPFSLMDRLSLIRSSFSSVLFPAFSYLHDAREKSSSADLHIRSCLAIFFLYAFFVLFFVILGRQFLFYWMGNNFAQRSTTILAILSTAGLVNALAAPSFVALQGAGKPQICAIFHVIEAILYVPACYFLIKSFGAVGAAEAWFFRVVLDTALLLFAYCNVAGISVVSWAGSFTFRAFVPTVVCAGLFMLMHTWHISLLSFAGFAAVAVTFAAYAASVWCCGMDNISRQKALIFLKERRSRWSQ